MTTMKKSLLILCTIAAGLFTNSTRAQCYDENTKLINLGVGFGNTYYKYFVRGGEYSAGVTPIFSLSYEQPLPRKVGPGYIGVGAYLSFQHAFQRREYKTYVYDGIVYNDAYYQRNINNYVIAARGAYHWDVLNFDKGEVYAGSIIGVRITTDNYTYHRTNHDDVTNEVGGTVFPVAVVYAGARWYFSDHVGFYGEVATGLSIITGGFTFKL